MKEDNSLAQMTTGTLWVFVGVVSGYLLEYANKILIARVYGPSDYGLIILLLTISLLTTSFALLGLHIGASRYIAFFTGEDKLENVRKVITLGLKIVIISAFVFAAVLFLMRNYIIHYFIKRDVPSSLLIIFILIIPIIVAAEYLYSCFRGMKLAKKAVISKEIIRRVFTVTIVIVSILLGYNLTAIGFAYLIGFAAYLTIMIIWIRNHIPHAAAPANISTKEYVLFSLPLLFSFILKQLGGQMSIFFIGYFRDTAEVGLYSAALSFAKLTSLSLDIMLFMFVPIVSELSAKQQDEEIKRIIRVTSSVLFITSSFFLVSFLLIPKLVMTVSFGRNFAEAYKALAILSISYFYYANCGISGALLVCFGETKKYFIADLFSVVAALMVFPIFVKNYGFVGASYAVLVRMLVLNSLWLIFTYRMTGLLPVTGKMFVCCLITLSVVIGCKIVFNSEWVVVLMLCITSISILSWRFVSPSMLELCSVLREQGLFRKVGG